MFECLLGLEVRVYLILDLVDLLVWVHVLLQLVYTPLFHNRLLLCKGNREKDFVLNRILFLADLGF
jgi:hypothetical protein